MLFTEDGLESEVLLTEPNVTSVEVVVTGAEDVLDPLALILGVSDLVKVTLEKCGQLLASDSKLRKATFALIAHSQTYTY